MRGDPHGARLINRQIVGRGIQRNGLAALQRSCRRVSIEQGELATGRFGNVQRLSVWADSDAVGHVEIVGDRSGSELPS